MNVINSSGWLEYFAGSPNAQFFADAIEDDAQLLVSAINIYEVTKRIEQQYGAPTAMRFLQGMRRGSLVPVDETLALRAMSLSIRHKLPMADSMILATAQAYNASIDGVRYIAKV